MSYEAPKKFEVKFEPAEFVLALSKPESNPLPEIGYEYLILPGVDYVKAKIVDVRVAVSESVKPGDYSVKISAKGSDNKEGMLSTSLVRTFDLNIKVLGKKEGEPVAVPEPSIGGEVTKNQTSIIEQKPDLITYNTTTPDQSFIDATGMLLSKPETLSLILLLITIIIAAVLWLREKE